MKFNDHFRHKELFEQVKDIYQSFTSFEDYNPSVCADISEIEDLSVKLGVLLKESMQILDVLDDIMKDNYGC